MGDTESLDRCGYNSPPVKHLPCVDLPRVQSGTTPRFYGPMSRLTSAPVYQSNTSHAWTFHGCNLEQLLVFKALQVGSRVHQSTSQTPPTRRRSMYVIQNNSLFLGLYESVDECTSPLVEHLPRVKNPFMQSLLLVQQSAVLFNEVYYSAGLFSSIQFSEGQIRALNFSAVQCLCQSNAFQCNALQCSLVQFSVVQCRVVLSAGAGAIQISAIQFSAA